MSQENIDRLLRRPGFIRNPFEGLMIGEDEKDLHYVDVNGNGYKTQEDYQQGQNKLEQGSDGKYYPRQYGK